MSTPQAPSTVKSRGSNLLPTDAGTDTNLPGDRVAIQIPHRSLGPSAEEDQRNAESELWFDEANRRVTSQVVGLGDDAPFFLNDTEAAVQSGDNRSSSVPLEDPILSYMHTNDSQRENEELRSIIDDLTLDIKRLKRKIRRYKEKDPPQLRGDKLFDVRTYGLSSRRKRHLEKILQRFADDISVSPQFARNRRRQPLRKSNHVIAMTSLPDEDTRMALVAMLFEQLLCSSAIKVAHQYPLNAKPLPSSWYNLKDILGIIKQIINNVDIDFGRKALKRYSTTLELSTDGYCVRLQANESQNTSSYQKATESLPCQQIPLGQENINSKSRHKASFYVPYTFSTRDSEADDGDAVSMISSSSALTGQASVSSVRGRTSISQLEAQAPSSHDSQGRVTYYKDTSFYIDYSGESFGIVSSQEQEASSRLKGLKRKRKRQGSLELTHDEHTRQTANATADRFSSYANEKDSPKNLSESSSPILSHTEKPLTSVTDGYKTIPREFEASGVGGVVPDDNFAIHVMVEHAPVNITTDPDKQIGNSTKEIEGRGHNSLITSQGFLNHLLNKSAGSRLNDQSKNAFKSCVISGTHENLNSSSLPPATCGFFSSASSDDDSTDDGDNEVEEHYEAEKDASKDYAFKTGMRQAILCDDGESPASMESIEKWSAQVAASLGSDENASSLSERRDTGGSRSHYGRDQGQNRSSVSSC
ncbi:hypothetical protein UA08_00629 [Talaromyces atroroseus]|uniref:Frequency clock protein n=1 Tax=Talaromyces atroroseus TaxID=1441469 RepID=A0A225BEI5_TALAT|nr:hypothetical protein UA08_00629 [Talaromyces atroroseus]OKL64447.1 hypothetical protein UA08_00629 [Talaromyces atroroseus]